MKKALFLFIISIICFSCNRVGTADPQRELDSLKGEFVKYWGVKKHRSSEMPNPPIDTLAIRHSILKWNDSIAPKIAGGRAIFLHMDNIDSVRVNCNCSDNSKPSAIALYILALDTMPAPGESPFRVYWQLLCDTMVGNKMHYNAMYVATPNGAAIYNHTMPCPDCNIVHGMSNIQF